tara:strand:+ start:11487 stop:11987 length:501 start_codon:yes stop_codon:yes gene_type:complete
MTPKQAPHPAVTDLQQIRGERLRDRRKLLGLTQKQVTQLLPDATANNPNAVGRVETGEVQMTDTRAIFLSRILRVPVAWIYETDGYELLERTDDPFLDREIMQRQILGGKTIKKIIAAVGEKAAQPTIDLMVTDEILAVGANNRDTGLRISMKLIAALIVKEGTNV